MRRYGMAFFGLAATAGTSGVCARMEAPGPLLVLVAFVPALLVFDRVRGLGEAVAAGLVLSVLFALTVFSWFADAMATYASLPEAAGFLFLVLLAPVLEPQLVLLPVVRRLLRVRGAGGLRVALASALLYVGFEGALPKLFGDTLGLGLFPSRWLRQAADLGGAPGLTLVVWLVNEALRAGWVAASAGPFSMRVRSSLAPLGVAAALVAALAGYGAWRLGSLRGVDGAAPLLRVALVQGDLSRYGQLAATLGTFDATRAILDLYERLTQQALAGGDVDLVVWPETVYPTTFGSPKSPEGEGFDRELVRFVAAGGVPLLFGAYDAEDGREYNAAFLLEPEGPLRMGFDVYRKASLFPLTERVPRWLDRPAVRRALPWLGTWSAGDGARSLPLDLPGGRRLRVAPLVCYDAVDPALTRSAVMEGADLFVTLSNDSWFADGGGPTLHLVVSAFRSIETRRPQARVTNTGISAAIDPSGELTAVLPVHAREAKVATLEAGGGITPFVAWGHRLPSVALGAGMLLLLPRRRGPARGPSVVPVTRAVRPR